MEACKIVEGQRYSKKLNDKQVTNILRATCQRPQQREQSIREMVLHNRYPEDKFAQEFGIKVCSDLVSVPARVLPPPMLRYHDSGREKTCAPSVGQWNMINKKMINGGTMDNWACLSFSRMRPQEVQRFCSDLIHMCNATGMAFCPRSLVDIQSATPNNILNALRDVHRRTTEMLSKQEKGRQLQLLIVILPEISGYYGKIKKVCETDLGIVSQRCLPRHACRPNKQYLENVALKINVKVGGRNTVLERAFVRNGIPVVSEVPTIIFGADVTHPSPGEDSASSIAAVVASMDSPEITKYRGLVSAQPHRQEIIEDLFNVSKYPQRGTTVNGGMFRELLITFRRKTGRRPERIIFYRDGVSEGQFSHVLPHEMDAIRKACASLEEWYLPPVTFVVVERHHTNLFPELHGRCDITDKSGNIFPGTVVDLMICHPTEIDFYLCSHAGIQVAINPKTKSRATNREVLSESIKLHGKKSLGGKLPAYDGRKSLYTAGSLPFGSKGFVVTLVDPEKKDKESYVTGSRTSVPCFGQWNKFNKDIKQCLPIFVVCSLLLIMTWLPLGDAQPLGSMPKPQLCNYQQLTKEITGFCLTISPTKLCCQSVIAAVDAVYTGGQIPCICHVLKNGITVDNTFYWYRTCGGLKRFFLLIQNCTVQEVPSSPFAVNAPLTQKISPSKSKYVPLFVWLLIALGFFLLGLIGLLVFKLRKRRREDQAGPQLPLRVIRASAPGLSVSPPRRTNADDLISRQDSICESEGVPFDGALTRGRLKSLKARNV